MMWEVIYMKKTNIKLDYNLTSTAERKAFVEDYLYNALGIQEHEMMSDKITPQELEMLGNYILYAYDKENGESTQKKEQNKKNHQRVLIDNENGLKTYVVANRIHKKIVQVFDADKQKTIEQQATTQQIIDDMIENYRTLKKYISAKTISELSDNGLQKGRINANIDNDVHECNVGKVLFEVNSNEGIRSKHYPLDDVEFNYDDKLIKIILQNLQLLKATSQIYTVAHCIVMDFEQAIDECDFTVKQYEVINTLINNESIKYSDYGNLYTAISKLKKYL